MWDPRHCDIHGNEETNALARAVSSFAFVRPEPCLPLAPRVSGEGSGSGYLNHTAPHGA
jgi:hypothetical protein